MPFLIVGIVLLHLLALSTTGSNNPSGVPKKSKKDSEKTTAILGRLTTGFFVLK
jgi:quinol-cytochrome oxidoreductase complex cytochrome b subunit